MYYTLINIYKISPLTYLYIGITVLPHIVYHVCLGAIEITYIQVQDYNSL
jgi:hypothetical protein